MSTTYSRSSQIVAEILAASGDDYARASQLAVEALIGTLGYVRATQVVTEALIGTLGYVRATQVATEALIATLGYVRISQTVVEVLIANKELPMPLIYPTLAGLTYSVMKRPLGNFGTAEATSGGEVRVNFWNTVLWEWDLDYEYLPDFGGTGGTTSSDFKALLGFYASTGTGFLPFCYNDVDDNQVLGQEIGVADGVTTLFYLARTYGLSTYGTTTDRVGYVNTAGPVLNGNASFNVYVNGVLQPPTAYTLTQTTPMAQYITLTATPSSGAVITVDMSYYYWVRFLNPKQDFEKFMNKLWSTKKITLHSLRY